jgi:hypothetical protein
MIAREPDTTRYPAVHLLFAQQAARAPNATALVWRGG